MNIIIQDLRKGIKSNRYRYLIGIIIISAIILMFNKNILLEVRVGKQISAPGILDNILYLLCGMAEYIPNSCKPFNLPYVWMAIQFLCSFLVFNYMQQDLEGMGLDILIRSKSRRVWWLSKCIWNVITIISFYIGMYALCFLYSIIFAGGKIGFQPFGFEPSVFLKYMMIPIDSVNIQYFTILLLIVPLLTSIALSLAQMSFSIIVGPILSLMSIMIIDVFSAYFMNPVLVANYSMVMRSRILIRNGISPLICIIVDILLIIISIYLGGFIFRKKDIIENNGGSYEN